MRRLIIILSLLVSGQQLIAQVPERPWYFPDQVKIHYGGGIGFLSLGAGYQLLRGNKAEIDVMAGYLPESIGGAAISTISARVAYIPWRKELSGKYEIEPLTTGLVVYESFHKDLKRAADNDLYPAGYYSWPVRTRFAPYIGSRITRRLDKGPFRAITFYYEIGTLDLYLYYWTSNTASIPFTGILNTAFGFKAGF